MMLNVVMLSIITVNTALLSAIILNAIRLNVAWLSVMAPYFHNLKDVLDQADGKENIVSLNKGK
jgi:hypothetical protein